MISHRFPASLPAEIAQVEMQTYWRNQVGKVEGSGQKAKN